LAKSDPWLKFPFSKTKALLACGIVICFLPEACEKANDQTGLPVVLSAVASAKEEAFLTAVALAKEVAKTEGRGNGDWHAGN
jgi:hypothetical protein